MCGDSTTDEFIEGFYFWFRGLHRQESGQIAWKGETIANIMADNEKEMGQELTWMTGHDYHCEKPPEH